MGAFYRQSSIPYMLQIPDQDPENERNRCSKWTQKAWENLYYFEQYVFEKIICYFEKITCYFEKIPPPKISMKVTFYKLHHSQLDSQPCSFCWKWFKPYSHLDAHLLMCMAAWDVLLHGEIHNQFWLFAKYKK